MGQKVSPISFRLGITQQWRSRWYARKQNYGKYLVEDVKIRNFIKNNHSFAGIPLIEIERTLEQTIVIVHSARPGVMIGRRGASVEKLTEDLHHLLGRPIELKIVEVNDPSLSAQLVAEDVVQRLERRLPYRRILHQTSDIVMEAGAQGIKIQVRGRIGGIEIARQESLSVGKVPLHTIRANIDYGFAEALLAKGKVGVKVWVFKGEQVPEEKKDLMTAKKETPDKTQSTLVSSPSDKITVSK
ncbi:30S ribosomal protein S3 [Planctomycetota bacterium]